MSKTIPQLVGEYIAILNRSGLGDEAKAFRDANANNDEFLRIYRVLDRCKAGLDRLSRWEDQLSQWGRG